MNSEQNLTAMIVPFYLGEKPDLEGRTRHEIWKWDFDELECIHDFIQWLFTLSEKSAFNSNAPVVDETVVQAFKEDPRLQKHLLQSFSVMLNFYGLGIHKDEYDKILVDREEHYPIRKQEWEMILDRNYLRITRILKCLMILGSRKEAQAFFECLQQIYREDSDSIGGETFQYWKDAVKSYEDRSIFLS